MSLKEANARKMLCPMRYPDGETIEPFCLGMKCMWWEHTIDDHGDCIIPLIKARLADLYVVVRRAEGRD